jgi:hypothetical protein
MKRWVVCWRFIDEKRPHTSVVVARDRGHARERVWMLHVSVGELRREIKFISIDEEDIDGDA